LLSLLSLLSLSSLSYSCCFSSSHLRCARANERIQPRLCIVD
jgi:hypothetical protein